MCRKFVGSKMKVLILTTVMAPYRMKLFETLGEECDLTVCFETKNDVIRDDKWYIRNGTKFTVIPLKKWEQGTSIVHWDIAKYINELRPDIIILYEYSTKTSFLAMVQARRKNIPYLINCDGAFISANKIKKLLKGILIKNAQGLLAGSTSAKEYFEFYGGKSQKIFFHKFTSLYAFDIEKTIVPFEKKKEMRKQLGLLEKKTAISVGNFVSGKGFIELIHVWKSLDKDCQLLIIGSGEQKNEYFDLIECEKIDNIIVKDFMPYDELKKYYMASDLFVLNTKSDVWGLVINEAMACGLPVVTTNMCIAGRELVNDGENGYIIELGNQEEFKERIKMILGDVEKQERMGKYSLELIKNYTIENIAESHLKAFRAILE